MTYYHEQILKISPEIYGKEYLSSQVIRAKLFIDKHFADNLNLDHIAVEAFFSKFHFIRLFKKHYGRTPHQYLKEVRIAKAKTLLRTGMNVTGVCFAVGFHSVPSFTALFKKITGSTPLKTKAILDKHICKSFLIFA
jgi:AraC-like DNA-binding protein